MSKELEGKVAIVTGASSGIGAATVEALLQAGASVIAVARRRERLKELAARAGEPENLLLFEGDVTQQQVVDALMAKVKQWKGRLDYLINNAGVSRGAPNEITHPDDVKLMFDTNVLALVSLTRCATALLRETAGTVVNLSSTANKAALPGGAAYSASKAAVATFSESLRKELAPDNIRVVVIYPGLVNTELFDHFDDEKKAQFDKMRAAMHPLEPGDLARLIVFAVSQPEHVALNEIVIRPTRQIP
ncbi:MAG: SDR family oxidoreductase [Porticoccaceae bacterium]